MVAVSLHEIVPGLVIYLDHQEILKCKGCLTNTPNLMHIPTRALPFLMLQANKDLSSFLCVPLYTQENPDGSRIELDDIEKTGPGSGWIGRPSYWHRKNFWIIRTTCIVAASGADKNPANNRKRYSTKRLAEIIAHCNDSEIDFRPVS